MKNTLQRTPEFGLGTQTITTLVIDGKHYPKTQFRIGSHTDEGCDGDHWHADGDVFSVETPDDGITDPNRPACGFGIVGTVDEALFDITEDQAQDLLSIACKKETPPGMQGDYLPLTESEVETLDNLRKALLAAGLTKKGDTNAS